MPGLFSFAFVPSTRARRGFATCLLVGLVALLAADPASGEIHWRSAEAQAVPLMTPASIGQAMLEHVRSGEARHMVVQFMGPVGPRIRQTMKEAGVELLSYLGDNAFFVGVSTERLDTAALSRVSSLRGVQAIERNHKLHPMLAEGVVPGWAVVGQTESDEAGRFEDIVGAYVVFHRDVALDASSGADDGPALCGVDLCLRHGAVVRSKVRTVNCLVVELPYSRIAALADEDAVQWIEPPLPKMGPVNDSNRARVGADTVQAPPYNLNGSGVTVMVYDGGTARSTHVDFQGRLTVHDSSGMNYHSTHVAGTIGGAGIGNATYKGMAPGVTLLAYGLEQEGGLQEGFLYTDPCDMEDDYSEAINTYGADIANNSIGTNTAANNFPCDWEGNYNVTSQLIDTIVRGDGSNPLFTEPFRIVWANGNERNSPARCGSAYHTTAPPACAKNHITVGALNSNDDSMTDFSSWGPADDGRLKPDISGPGCQSNGDGGVTSCDDDSDTDYTTLCGTSMASPTVCGISALLLQDYRAQFPSKPDFRNSTLKVLLAHTAVDLGNTGPDYMYGYGSVRIQPAVDFMRTENFLENQVDQGETFTILATVGAGEELKVTLAWDDVQGPVNTNPELVNDLDLRVYSPSAVRHYPWTLGGVANPSAPAVRTQEDHINNIEQVLVDAPAEAGTWTIEVRGYNVPDGPQPFSLAVSPEMITCSSRGMIALDRSKYGCSDVATIQVVDCDLNTNSGQVETTTVTITSDSEPGGESVLLTETGPATADFRGSIALSETNSAGVLQVAHGDTITATYNDADDGTGNPAVVQDTATTDCQGPVISNVHVINIDFDTATVTFDTDEPANGTVRYGLSCGALSGSEGEPGYQGSHSIVLSGLAPITPYFFAVDAEDEGGNSSTDDNGGACYSFTTLDMPDACQDAEAACPGTYTGSTSGLSSDGDASCGSSGSSPDIFYKYKPATNGTLTVDLCDSSYDTVVSVHTGCPATTGNELGCDDDQGWFGECGWLPTQQSYLDVSVTAGTMYYIRVSGSGGASGNYVMGVSGPACAPMESCDDGIQNQGEDRIDCGGPCPPCDCLSDEACDDNVFCTGVETCDGYGHCQAGSDPCPGQECREEAEVCCDTLLADGDMNGLDGCNGDDIQLFVDALLEGSTDPSKVCPGDFSNNGVVDLADIDGMVDALLNL
ncbi:MAG: S8 family serine peptidase [Phycisphaerae bacterium]|nr:S8 family serine peptidase [Phycisphaerae bacterium]